MARAIWARMSVGMPEALWAKAGCPVAHMTLRSGSRAGTVSQPDFVFGLRLRPSPEDEV
jgi:hypothetical protein